MTTNPPPCLPAEIDPWARAPRAGANGDALQLAPAALQGAMVALIRRDTRSLALNCAQRLTHFPASPLVTISWASGTDVGLIDADRLWRPFDARVVVSGTQSHPLVSWASHTGRGHIACFTADAAQALFELDLVKIQDRFVPVAQAIDARWSPLWDNLLASPDQEVLSVFERHLAPRWQALQGRATAGPSLRQLGNHWVERLAWQAQQWRQGHSARQVERRVKSFSGRSLREWQSLVRTEDLFFAARDRYDSGQPLAWADLAHEQGFADQAHMNRVAKRITGFAPGEFASRFMQDESFWLYRLWV